MLSFRRALAIASFVLSCLLYLKQSHRQQASDSLYSSPKPTGSYQDNRKIIGHAPESQPMQDAVAESSDSHNIIALAKKQNPQVPFKDLKLQPLRKQLAYMFPYGPESKFPAYIWQTWKTTPAMADFEDDFRPAEASWTWHHPMFVHEVITDDVAESLIRHFYASVPEIVEAYTSLPRPVLKADFFRYLILLARGGIYSDIDTWALTPAVDWVPAEVPRSSYGLVIGIEADPDRPDWKDWYSRRIQFCQWTIQAKPGHPVLVDIVATITEEALRMKRSGELTRFDSRRVVDFTGPAIWTDIVFKFFNNPEYFDMTTSEGNISWHQFTGITEAKKVGDVIVLPITCFSPGVGQMGAGEDDDPMAFVKHTFHGTWKPESERHIGEQPPPVIEPPAPSPQPQLHQTQL